MSSIASLTSTAPLSKPAPTAARAQPGPPVPENAGGSDASPVLSSDASEGFSGHAALARVATTPVWSTTFELPKQPELPASTKKPWDWESTPDITVKYAGGAPSFPRASASWDAGGAPAMDDDAEPEEEMNFFDLVTWPIRTITGGVVSGVNAVVDTWQNVGRAVGEGAKSLVNAVGNVAADAWKAITGIRLW